MGILSLHGVQILPQNRLPGSWRSPGRLHAGADVGGHQVHTSGWCRMPSPGLIGSVHENTAHRVRKGGRAACPAAGCPGWDGEAGLGSASTSSRHLLPAWASPMPKLAACGRFADAARPLVGNGDDLWFNDFTSFLIVLSCACITALGTKSRHLKQVTASLKSNILLCLESKGFEFLSAIHLSLMKHLLQFDLFQYDFRFGKDEKSD